MLEALSGQTPHYISRRVERTEVRHFSQTAMVQGKNTKHRQVSKASLPHDASGEKTVRLADPTTRKKQTSTGSKLVGN